MLDIPRGVISRKTKFVTESGGSVVSGNGHDVGNFLGTYGANMMFPEHPASLGGGVTRVPLARWPSAQDATVEHGKGR